MPFWKCYYHIVWATRNRTPLIVAQYEPVIFKAIRDKSVTLDCDIHALNGVEDHIHVAVSIPPKIAVAEWVRQIKGIAAYTINRTFDPDPRFHWQEGYGVHTFGARRLDFVTGYIVRQKEHHAAGLTYTYLEQDS